MSERRDPFNPFGNMTLAERRGPFATPSPTASYERRAEDASRALERARRDLDEARRLNRPDDDDKPIARMESPAHVVAPNDGKAMANLIILAGRRARGEVACEMSAGPKVFVKMTPEAIIAAARKAHGQD